MAKKQRDWARKKRDKIFDILGRKCVKCGSTKDLEFDVIIPFDSGAHTEREWSWRMSFYWHELERRNLQILCTKCNSAKGNQMELTDMIDCPF